MTGKVNGYIDFECAVTAPLWLAAEVVDWVPDPMTDRTNWWGGTRADQFRLWKTYHSVMDACDEGGEWRKAYEGGKLFRLWAGRFSFNWQTWAELHESDVDEILTWANKEENKGVGMPEIDEEFGIDWDEVHRRRVLEKYGPDPTLDLEA